MKKMKGFALIAILILLLSTVMACDEHIVTGTGKGCLTYGISNTRSLTVPVRNISIRYRIFKDGTQIYSVDTKDTGYRYLRDLEPGEYVVKVSYTVSNYNTFSTYFGKNSCIVEPGKNTVCKVKIEQPSYRQVSFRFKDVDPLEAQSYGIKLITPDGKTTYDMAFSYYKEFSSLISYETIPNGSYKVQIATPAGVKEDSITFSYDIAYDFCFDCTGKDISPNREKYTMADPVGYVDKVQVNSQPYVIRLGSADNLSEPYYYLFSGVNCIAKNPIPRGDFELPIDKNLLEKIGEGKHTINLMIEDVQSGELWVRGLSFDIVPFYPRPRITRVDNANPELLIHGEEFLYDYRMTPEDMESGWSMSAYIGDKFISFDELIDKSHVWSNVPEWKDSVDIRLELYRFGHHCYNFEDSIPIHPKVSASFLSDHARYGTEDKLESEVYIPARYVGSELYAFYWKDPSDGSMHLLDTYSKTDHHSISVPHDMYPGIYEIYGGYVFDARTGESPRRLKYYRKVRVM